MRFFFARPKVDSPVPPRAVFLVRVLVTTSFVFSLSAVSGFASSASGDGALTFQVSQVSDREPVSTATTDLQSAVVEERNAGSLLDALAESEDDQSADVLARQIQALWNQSGSESVDLLMHRSTLAIRTRDYLLALDLLDTVIALAPHYAEGWNRRATVHFLRDDYALSIADVEQVLRLEPRHFGALSGIGIILDELGQDEQARLFLREALRVHPHLTGARQRLDAIDRRLLGAPI